MFNQSLTTRGLVLVLSIVSASICQAAILTQNSTSYSNNAAAYAAWLSDIGITEVQVEYFVDFETGFIEGQNISGVSSLLPGGLIITDTSGSYGAMIRGSSTYFGGSVPIGAFAVSHNESPYLQLDFTASPVDYVSFQDIDHTNVDIFVDFVDGTSTFFDIDGTATGGSSAEFTGIYRNDMPQIKRLRLDASGDNEWGIDNIRYGRLPEPCWVDLEDFSHFAAQWMMTGTLLPADLDTSGEVNLADLDLFLDHWLAECPAGWQL